jgi:hypothetical protein
MNGFDYRGHVNGDNDSEACKHVLTSFTRFVNECSRLRRHAIRKLLKRQRLTGGFIRRATCFGIVMLRAQLVIASFLNHMREMLGATPKSLQMRSRFHAPADDANPSGPL